MGGTQVQYWMILADIVHFLCWVSTWRLRWPPVENVRLQSEIWRMCKFCPTMWTSVWTFVSVFRSMVQFQISWIWKGVSTMITCIWLLPTVDSPLVVLQVATLSECSPTVPTFIWSLPCVCLKMCRFLCILPTWLSQVWLINFDIYTRHLIHSPRRAGKHAHVVGSPTCMLVSRSQTTRVWLRETTGMPWFPSFIVGWIWGSCIVFHSTATTFCHLHTLSLT